MNNLFDKVKYNSCKLTSNCTFVYHKITSLLLAFDALMSDILIYPISHSFTLRKSGDIFNQP
jgi:hypothetical protein